MRKLISLIFNPSEKPKRKPKNSDYGFGDDDIDYKRQYQNMAALLALLNAQQAIMRKTALEILNDLDPDGHAANDYEARLRERLVDLDAQIHQTEVEIRASSYPQKSPHRRYPRKSPHRR